MHPALYVQLPFLVLRVLLCLDPSPPWDFFSALILALVCYLTINSSVFKFNTDAGNMNQGFGTAITTCAVDGFYLLLLAKPLRNFKYIGNGKGSAREVWWKKYLDVMCIPSSPRLIGWSHQIKDIPPAPQQSRYSFVLRSTLRAIGYALLFQTGELYVWYNPAYSPTIIGTQGYITQTINAAVFLGLSYWAINAMYFALAAGSVAIGLYEPRMWPDLFGAWGDAYTVRRFWQRTWHQMMRRFLSSLSKVMSTALGFQPGTLWSSYARLYIAFFLSGLIHTGGDIVLSFRTPAAPRSFFSIPYFLLQAFIITLEEMLIWMARRLGVKSSVWTRILGYVWVTAWIGWCLSGSMGSAIRAGGGIREAGADPNAMDSNLVQATLGFLGVDVRTFAESWFSEA